MAEQVRPFPQPPSSSTLDDVIGSSGPPPGAVRTKRLSSDVDTKISASEPTRDYPTAKSNSATTTLPWSGSTSSKESLGESSEPPPERTPKQPPADAAPLAKKQGAAASAPRKQKGSRTKKNVASGKRQQRLPFVPRDDAPRPYNQTSNVPKLSPCTAVVERQDTTVSCVPPALSRALQVSPTFGVPEEVKAAKRTTAPTVGASIVPSSSTLEESLTTRPTPDIVTTRRLQSLEDTRGSTSSLTLPQLNTIFKHFSDVTSEMSTYSKSSLQRATGESDKPSPTLSSTEFLSDAFTTLHNREKPDSTPQKPEVPTATPKYTTEVLKNKRSSSLELPPGSKHCVQNDSSAEATFSSCTDLVVRQDMTVACKPENLLVSSQSVKDSDEYSKVVSPKTPGGKPRRKPRKYASDKTTVQVDTQETKADTQAIPSTETRQAAPEISTMPAKTFEKTGVSIGFSPAEGSLSKDRQSTIPKPSSTKALGKVDTQAIPATATRQAAPEILTKPAKTFEKTGVSLGFSPTEGALSKDRPSTTPKPSSAKALGKVDTQAIPATATRQAASEISTKPATTFEKTGASLGFSPAEESLSQDRQSTTAKPSSAKPFGEKETTAAVAPESELSSRKQPLDENLNRNTEVSMATSTPTYTEPPLFTPVESNTPLIMGTGIPVSVPVKEDSGKAAVRKKALKSYLSSPAASSSITRNVAFEGSLSEGAAVRTQGKVVSKGTEKSSFPCSFSPPTPMPVSKPISPSTTERIKEKEKQTPKLPVRALQQPTEKQDIRTIKQEVPVTPKKKTQVPSESSTKPTDSSSSTVRDRTEASIRSSGSTHESSSSSHDLPIIVSRRAQPEIPGFVTNDLERFAAPRVTTGEYGLYVAALSLGIILIVIMGFFLVPLKQQYTQGRNMVSERSGETCTSASCLKNALYLGKLLQWNDGRACDDFYAFVCSRWTSQFPLSSNFSSSTYDDYVMTLEDRIYASLQNDFRSSVIFQPLKALHDACVDVSRSPHQDRDLLDFLMSDVSLGGFPLSSSTRGTVPVWTAAARILRKTGTLALLSVSVVSKPGEKAGDIVSIGPPELLTSSRVDAEEVFRVYTEAVFSAARIFKKQDTKPRDIIADVRFAMEIEKLGPLRQKGSFWSIDPRRRSGSNLLEFVTEVFRGSENSAFKSTMSELLVWSPGFTSDVLSLVENSPPHTVMNYLGIRLLIQIAPFIPDSGLMDALNFLVHGKRHPAPSRWQLCVRVVEKALYPLVYASIFTHVKLRTSRSSLASFVQAILDEFSSEIESSPHFDPNSKDAIHRVLSSTAVSLIGPTWCEHGASIQDYIDQLPDQKAVKSALDMYISYYEHTFFYALSRGSRGRWRGSAFSTNCWYEAHPRTVHVPLLAFNVTQVFDDGDVNELQAPRLAPQLNRCLFDMLLDETDSANSSADHWITEDTWKRLLSVEACLAGRQDFLRFGRFRDVLAVQVALKAFEKAASSSYALPVRLANGATISGSQVFFTYMMLQSCDKSGSAWRNAMPAATDEWRAALLNNARFRSAFNCSKSTVSKQPSQCSL